MGPSNRGPSVNSVDSSVLKDVRLNLAPHYYYGMSKQANIGEKRLRAGSDGERTQIESREAARFPQKGLRADGGERLFVPKAEANHASVCGGT